LTFSKFSIEDFLNQFLNALSLVGMPKGQRKHTKGESLSDRKHWKISADASALPSFPARAKACEPQW